MKARWQVQEAKADLSSVIRAAEAVGPQTITRNGKAVAVLVSQGEFERFSRRDRPAGTLVEFFASWPDLAIPERDAADTGRDVEV